MVLYGITLVPLVEELQAADLRLITPLYEDDAEFDGSVRRSAKLLKLLMERGLNRGYFSKSFKLLFIADTPVQENAAKREFVL